MFTNTNVRYVQQQHKSPYTGIYGIIYAPKNYHVELTFTRSIILSALTYIDASRDT